jgi:tellurite resistance protein TerB
MSFDSFLSSLKTKASEMKTGVLKFKNREFMDATMAGSALIAMADGSITSDEKQKMVKFIESHDALSVFTTNDVIKSFQDYVGQLEFDNDIGQAKAYQALGKLKNKDEPARLVMRMVIAIAGADGNFDDSEKLIAAKIAREMGLNPAEFELG